MTAVEVLIGLWAVLLVAAAFSRWQLRNEAEAAALENPSPGERPGPYEVAAVFGGSQRVVDAGVATLLERGALAVDADGRLAAVTAYVPPVAEAPVESAVRHAVGYVGPMPLKDVRRRLVRDRAVAAVIARVQELGLVVDTSRRDRLAWSVVVPAGVLAFVTWIAGASHAWGVQSFLLGGGGVVVILLALPGEGYPSREGRDLKASITNGAAPNAVLESPEAVSTAGWITTVHGVSTARRLSAVPLSLALPTDQQTKGSGGGGWLNWLGWDDDGCGGCSCG